MYIVVVLCCSRVCTKLSDVLAGETLFPLAQRSPISDIATGTASGNKLNVDGEVE